jgi:hypothetical protein
MHKYADEFARCLATCDVKGIRRLHQHVRPDLPQPKNDHEALFAIHHARTLTETFAFRLRAYSHAWLRDHNYPSGLPDELKPKAERLYPRFQEAVGIVCGGTSEIGRAVAPIIRGAMSDAVMDVYADDKHPDAVLVKSRMMEARRVTIKKLIGK